MKLEDIGFYTLSDERAKTSCSSSPLMRNELIITALCNFTCSYCRGTDMNGEQGHMPLDDVKRVVDVWAENDIRNIRFSGGEPTMHPDLKEIISYTKSVCKNIENIALSTNGSRSTRYYDELVVLGVNDFSISLDACCAEVGDSMAGGKTGVWHRIVKNIKHLSKKVYVTVGVVIDHENYEGMRDTILFAHSLGVADIRLISTAQWNDPAIFNGLDLPQNLLDAHPIMNYRLQNFRNNRNVRGMSKRDFPRCALALDDIIAKGDYHYKCVIHMREGGEPIGKIGPNIRKEREHFFRNHNTYLDPVCRGNCLDVCVDYNNRWAKFHKEEVNMLRVGDISVVNI